MPLFHTTPFNASLFGGVAPSPGFVPRQVGKGILYPALRKAGVTLGPQRTPSPAQFQDSIDELNRLTGTLNCDRLFIYSIAGAQYPLTSGKTSYTIGLSNDPFAVVDFPAERPQLIESANILSGGTAVTRLAIATDPEWAKICCGGGNGASALYNDRAYPVSTLTLSGPPAGDTLELFTWRQVPYFLTITDEVLLPMQYEDALVLNLAIRLVTHFPIGPTMPRQVDPMLYQQAREALMHLRSINASQPIADTGALGCCGGDWNIYTGASGGGGGGAVAVQGPPGPPGPPGPAAVKYTGIVERNATMHGPPGWTITHPTTGVYTITHNLNLNPVSYAVVATFARGTLDPIDPGKASGIVVHVRDQQPNLFTVVMGEGKDLTSFIDAGFNFSLSP